MRACCALSVMCFLLNYEPIYGYRHSPSTAVDMVQAVRSKRQAGMQMYYAYPAPAERNVVNIGVTSTGSSAPAARGSTGYNYDAPISQSGSNTVNGGSSRSNSNSYTIQNTAAQNTQSENTGIIPTNDAGINGYNYGVQNIGAGTTESVSVGNVNNYGDSAAIGYDYGVQNTAIQVTSGQNTQSEATGSTGSTGYSYGIQNNAINNVAKNTATNTVTSGYTQVSTQATNADVSTGGVSTNAPKYLPPSNSEISATNSASNTQTGSSVAIVAPSDMYLPPSETVRSTPVDTVVQITSSDAINSRPISRSYLEPKTLPNAEIVQTQTTLAPVKQTQQVSVQNYLPPDVTQGTVSTPASSYLPPVF